MSGLLRSNGPNGASGELASEGKFALVHLLGSLSEMLAGVQHYESCRRIENEVEASAMARKKAQSGEMSAMRKAPPEGELHTLFGLL